MTHPPPRAADPAGTITDWRGAFENAEVDALHAACFGPRPSGGDWRSRLDRFSLGWACARRSGALIGFVNVAWDGGRHAFVLDAMVAPALRRRGIGRALIAEAAARAGAAGCEWLHADFEPHLRPLYVAACGFEPTDAGLIRLR